jgi:pimeloyl-ACP methyl ester carboxylesterase
MAFVERPQGARIWWGSVGKGEPVVMLMGLGCSSALWFRIAPRLARTHRVILIDNRGTGQSRAPGAVVHRVAHMAADVDAVLEAAGEPDAHVVGFSMGGMIAQQFAVDFPHRVRTLALLGTNPGGPRTLQAAASVRRLLFDKATMSPEEALVAMRPYTYGRDTPDALFEEDSLVRIANQPSARDYRAQLHALLYWSAYRQLASLEMPLLVVHGLQDALIPPGNGRLIASRVPGARLVELAHASHWLTTDATEECLQALRGHLDDRRM